MKTVREVSQLSGVIVVVLTNKEMFSETDHVGNLLDE